jgi:hypothetical protein
MGISLEELMQVGRTSKGKPKSPKGGGRQCQQMSVVREKEKKKGLIITTESK